MRYAVVIAKAEQDHSASAPDLPGCMSTGATVAEVEREMGEAIHFHLGGLRGDGTAPPEPRRVVDGVDG